LLSKSMKQYVLNKEKNGYNKEIQNVYNNRLRAYAIQALKDLALLADKLPEAEQAQVFNNNTMAPLFQSLFSFSGDKPGHNLQTIEDLSKKMDQEQLQKRRSRILLLCYETVNVIGDTMNAHNIAPYEMSILLNAGQNDALPALTGTKAVYLKGFGLHQLPPRA
jgi:hypothetical protein